MGPIAIRRRLRRDRRRLGAIVAVVVCAGAIAAHHSGIALGGGHHEMDMSAAAGTCLAAFTAVGAAVVAVVIGLIALGRRHPPLRLTATSGRLARRPPRARARASPDLPLLLCVSRR